MSFLNFLDAGFSESGKTKRWKVTNHSAVELGLIKWYPQWRKYCYFPVGPAVYDEKCLKEISEMLEKFTRLHSAREE